MAPQHIEVVRKFGRASAVSNDECKGRTQPLCAREEEYVEGVCCRLRLKGVLGSKQQSFPYSRRLGGAESLRSSVAAGLCRACRPGRLACRARGSRRTAASLARGDSSRPPSRRRSVGGAERCTRRRTSSPLSAWWIGRARPVLPPPPPLGSGRMRRR